MFRRCHLNRRLLKTSIAFCLVFGLLVILTEFLLPAPVITHPITTSSFLSEKAASAVNLDGNQTGVSLLKNAKGKSHALFANFWIINVQTVQPDAEKGEGHGDCVKGKICQEKVSPVKEDVKKGESSVKEATKVKENTHEKKAAQDSKPVVISDSKATHDAKPVRNATESRSDDDKKSKATLKPETKFGGKIDESKNQRNPAFKELKNQESLEKSVKLNDTKATETLKIVNPHDFVFFHNVPGACEKRRVDLVAGVTGRTNGFENRITIRETWANTKGNKSLNGVIVLFFLGWTSNKTLQAEIDKESKKYGDIVQETFVDHYRNLSLKSISLMKWATTFCSHSSYVLKADDDIYINLNNLLTALKQYSSKGHSHFITGSLHPSVEPIRDVKSRYRVTEAEFPDDKFPPYVSGTAYALTTTAAGKLYNMSLYVPKFSLEDVYVTGVLAEKANVSRLYNMGFTKHDYDGCALRKSITSGHNNLPAKIREIHMQRYDMKLNCTELAIIAKERYADYIKKKVAAKKKTGRG